MLSSVARWVPTSRRKWSNLSGTNDDGNAASYAWGHSRHSCHPGVSGSPQKRTFGHCRCFVALQALSLSNLRFVRLKPAAVFSKVSNLRYTPGDGTVTARVDRAGLERGLRRTEIRLAHRRDEFGV